MGLLFEVVAFYLVLALIAVACAWLAIARRGFAGIQQTNSRLAKLFRTRATATWQRPQDQIATSSVVVAAEAEEGGLIPAVQYVGTTVILATLLICCTPRQRNLSVPLFSPNQCPIRATTAAPEAQRIDARVHRYDHL
jgi:hypothetical protein